MPGAVKGPRPYRSPRRAEQAAAPRRSILDAAARRFEAQGYAATTMEAIATEAGVSLKTVYVAFTTKSGLLRALWDLQLKGDQDDSGVAERPWFREVLEEPEPERQLRRNAKNARAVKERIASVLKVIRDAAPVDADTAALWDLIQTDFYENQRVIVTSIAGKGALRPDLDITRATDILWTLNHPDQWFLLVGRRGWSADEFEQWFADVSCAQLLRPDLLRR